MDIGPCTNFRCSLLEYVLMHIILLPQTSWLDPDRVFTINLWLYGVVMKLVPCLVLGVVTALLIHEMYKVSPNIYKKVNLNQYFNNMLH